MTRRSGLTASQTSTRGGRTRNRVLEACLLWACLQGALSVAAYAQPPAFTPERTGEDRVPLPELPPAGPAPQMGLPALPRPSAQDPLSAQLRVFVRDFKFVGNTAFSDAALGRLTADYENRSITSAELQEVRHRLTLHYINNGYINSGVIIPDQQVVDNVITLQVIEGELSQIEVGGNKRLRSDYVSERVALAAQTPLNINTLQTRLQLLQQDPLINRVNATLAPTPRLGGSVLQVLIDEQRPYQVAITANNHRSPSVGAERLQLEAFHGNLTGRGDRLSGRYGLTEGLDDFAISYERPLNARDTTLKLRYEVSDSDVIEEPFDVLDIQSESRTFEIALRHPLWRTTNEEFALSFALERRRSETFLLGDRFPFSPGTRDGKSDVTVLRFKQEWTRRSRAQVLAARSVFSLGVDAFGATAGADPDGQFLAWLGQFQWARRFGDNDNQIIVRADVQLAEDPLLPLEKFAVGGANSVRGYRENQLVRDNGAVISAELRIPLFRSETGESHWQLAPFVDFGRAWNKNSPTPEPRTLGSAGVGLRWDPSPKFHAELYLADEFRIVDNPGHDLQDSGIHFQASYRFF